jgi:exodeoxyribonuclease III
MRILTWNCQGAFRKKYERIAKLVPDLAVIQECEHPDKLTWKNGTPPSSLLWFGEKPSKGLGIFSWTDLTFHALEGFDTGIRYCVPLEVSAPYHFRIVAVWAMDHRKDNLSYSAQVYQAVSLYREFITGADTVFLGDFNSSKRTTPKSRIGNHTTLSTTLDDLWLESAYHHTFHEKQGRETQGTFFRGRDVQKPTHIDYAYIPVRWLRRLQKAVVGNPAEWLSVSDHCPLWVDIQEKEYGVIV